MRPARFSAQSQSRLSHRPAPRFQLDTGAGRVEVQAWHGQAPGDQPWGSPLRERWQLAAYPQPRPGWQPPLAFTLTVTPS